MDCRGHVALRRFCVPGTHRGMTDAVQAKEDSPHAQLRFWAWKAGSPSERCGSMGGEAGVHFEKGPLFVVIPKGNLRLLLAVNL